jgi:hypothetical protein
MIAILVAVMLIGIFLTLNFVYASQNQNYLGGFLLYNNSDYNFQVLYPQNWITTEGVSDDPGDFLTVVAVLEPLGEQGKHYTKNFLCGEVCLLVTKDNAPELKGYSIEQYADYYYNTVKENYKGFKLLEYKTPSNYKVGDKKAFELLFQQKQGKREYVKKVIGLPYDENSFLIFEFKSRDKYSDEIVPLTTTMVNSIRINQNNTQ